MGAKKELARQVVTASADGFPVKVLVGGQWIETATVELDDTNMAGVLICTVGKAAGYIDVASIQAVIVGEIGD